MLKKHNSIMFSGIQTLEVCGWQNVTKVSKTVWQLFMFVEITDKIFKLLK